MPKVRLLHVHQGLGKGPGSVVEADDEWCRKIVAAGHAESVGEGVSASGERRRARVLLTPPEGEPANVWVWLTDLPDGRLGVETLTYPDLAPAPGWTLTLDEKELAVLEADGVNLVCGEAPRHHARSHKKGGGDA